MAPRPTSPTSLLWAHQLRREHGHLQERIKTLEEENNQSGPKLKTIDEKCQLIRNEIGTLVTRLNTIEKENEQINRRLAEFRTEAEEIANDHEFNIQKLHQRLEKIESAYAIAKDELALVNTTNFNLTKRVDRLEEQQRKTTETEKRIGRKNDPADARALSKRVELLELKRSEDAVQLKELQDKLCGVEKEYRSLVTAYNIVKSPNTGTAQRYESVEENQPLQTPNVPSSGRSEQLPASPLVGKEHRRMNESFLSARPLDLRTKLDQHVANASGFTKATKHIPAAFEKSQPRRSARTVNKQAEAANPGNSFPLIRKSSLRSAQATATTKRKSRSPPPEQIDVSKRSKTGKPATTILTSPRIVYERPKSRHTIKSNNTHHAKDMQVNLQERQVMTGSVDIFEKPDHPGQKKTRRVIVLEPLPPLEEL